MVQPAAAEYYRYTDSHGNVLYTDDFSKVPVEQRPQARIYEDAPSTPPPAAATPKKTDAQQAESALDGLEKERNQLEEKEKAINIEYDELMKARASLDDDKASAVSPDQIKAYNQKIADFNARIKAYEEKRSGYSEEVKAFNERVKAEKQKSEKREEK